MEDKQILLDNIDKIHTTEMGIGRIKKNLKTDVKDVVGYCKNIVSNGNCSIRRQGKNWCCEADHTRLTINANTFTIISAHIVK